MPMLARTYKPDEESLIAATLLRERDTTVFKILYSYDKYCMGHLKQKFPNISEVDLENCVADGILRAFRLGSKYNPQLSSVKTWLMWNVKAVVYEFLDSHQSQLHIPLDTVPNLATNSGDSAPVATDEIKRRVKTLLASLPEYLRVVLEMQLEGYPNSEIAKTLDITEDTVRGRKKRAIDRLRRGENQ
jgi:RNA polymerase sigma factor (sigma-70 family)